VAIVKNRSRIAVPIVLAWIAGLVLLFGPAPIALAHDPGKCPRGSTPVEDIASGKIKCERSDNLDTESIGTRTEARVPAQPGSPGAPGKPRRPESPEMSGEKLSKDPSCGLSHWGCEQSCQKTYLSAATGSSPQASPRAKAALTACLRICGEEFSCPVRAPKTP
jgi:hypothetical protein